MRRFPVTLTTLLSVALVLGVSVPTSAVHADDDHRGHESNDRDDRRRVGGADFERVRRGFEIAPVPLDLKGKKKLLVGLGSYIVNAQGGCNDCHTQPNYAPGGDPFAGEPEQINTEQYLSGGRIFGPFVSRNLTPDADGLPGGLTRRAFFRALRTGHDPDDPDRLLQVMPWPVYGNMIDLDLHAIYEFLRSIPSLEDNPNPS